MKTLASILMIGLMVSGKAIPSENPANKARINLSYCSNIGPGVDYLFTSCVNNNFSQIGRLIGGFYSYCLNNGPGVDYFYTYCVNTNFISVERALQNRVFLQDCQNYDRSRLDYFYLNCVNQNFRQIQREIERK